MNFFDEGIELALRRDGDSLWTPLAFFTIRVNSRGGAAGQSIRLGYDGGSNVPIRGFSVPVTENDTDTQHLMQFRICNEMIVGARSVQFRWLQTAQHYNIGIRDRWSLDSVQVLVTHDSECSGVAAFFDDFEYRTNSIR